MNGDILVTIILLSYNAERYIIEALQSIKMQNHPKIELIIIDDCSQDNTVNLEKEWLKDNGNIFTNTKLIAQSKNYGTVANSNLGLKYSNGNYINFLAADDILTVNSVEDCLNACIKNQWEIAVGEAEWVQDDGKSPAIHKEDIEKKNKFYAESAQKQYKHLLKDNDIICSPAAFYKMSFLKKYQGFDEAYTLIEDYPFWLKITANGDHINHFDHVVVKYRQSITSATNPEKAVQIYNARITKDSKKIFYRQRMWGLLKNGQIKIVVRNIRRYFIRDLVIMLGNSSKKKLCYALTRFE
ncbi:glycosyltransferase [Roseburia inulinivorans]|nr:glycosyltransferase [Roseburia inulinivorans]